VKIFRKILYWKRDNRANTNLRFTLLIRIHDEFPG